MSDVLGISIDRETDNDGNPTGNVRAVLRCRIKEVGGGQYTDRAVVVDIGSAAQNQLKAWIENEALVDFNAKEGFPVA